MTNKNITIVIPIHNCELFIRKCLDTVLSQSIENIEVIIVDDASTDGSLSKIPCDNRVKIIRNRERKGAGFSRNLAISFAKGKYIAFMDGDDFYPNNDCLKKLFEEAERSNADIVGGSLSILDDEKHEFNNCFAGQFFEKEKFLVYKDYQHDGGFYKFIYKKKFLKENNIIFPNLSRMQDPVFLVKAMLAASKIFVIPDQVYVYRKKHKKIKWTKDRILDKLIGIRQILRISKENQLPHLHYLMVKNFFDFTKKHIHFGMYFSQFVLTLFEIDFKLLNYKWSSDRFNYSRCRFLYLYIRNVFY